MHMSSLARASCAVVGGAALVLAGSPAVAADPGKHKDDDHRVVVDGLNNPRQLNWSADLKTLVIAEAGRGGTTCVPDMGCSGPTGAVTLVKKPHQKRAVAVREVQGFQSFAGPDGSFAVGSNGADALETLDEGFIIAGSDFDSPPMQGGAMLVAISESPGNHLIIDFADLAAAERTQNPDKRQIESNPYAILFVDPTPKGPIGVDGYALVADAAANTVWKVEPDLSYEPPASTGCFTEQAATNPAFDWSQCFKVAITPWAVFEPTSDLAYPGPNATEAELEAYQASRDPEFVPTSLATDKKGHVYVGGLGSEVAGAAEVVHFTADGDEVERFTGFTGITGVAVHGHHLYVSQLFGDTPPMPEGETPAAEAPTTQGVPGSIVKTDRRDTDSERYAVDVPLPAGLAADHKGRLYASVNSVAPSGGIAQSPFGPVGGGAVWEIDWSDAELVED